MHVQVLPTLTRRTDRQMDRADLFGSRQTMDDVDCACSYPWAWRLIWPGMKNGVSESTSSSKRLLPQTHPTTLHDADIIQYNYACLYQNTSQQMPTTQPGRSSLHLRYYLLCDYCTGYILSATFFAGFGNVNGPTRLPLFG